MARRLLFMACCLLAVSSILSGQRNKEGQSQFHPFRRCRGVPRFSRSAGSQESWPYSLVVAAARHSGGFKIDPHAAPQCGGDIHQRVQ